MLERNAASTGSTPDITTEMWAKLCSSLELLSHLPAGYRDPGTWVISDFCRHGSKKLNQEWSTREKRKTQIGASQA